ncbi:MAG: TetR/AcrR family transcriptional regulator [Clostridia bacterium]|nr:TetR/AcrR family transcriptional regulator [Clostridia bacterium]
MEQKKKTEITKNKILEAAEAEFSALGLAAARVDSIAKSAGVNKQMIYAHFESKEGLYTAVLSRVYGRLSVYQETIAAYTFQGAETVRRIISDYFDFLMENPSFVRLMLWENLNDARYAAGIDTELFVGAERLLREGVERGMLRPTLDVEQTVISMNMFCFSAFSNLHTLSKISGIDLKTPDALRVRREHITELFLKYVFE